MLKLLRFDIFEQQETKLPVRLIYTTNERGIVQGHELIPLRVKEDIEDVSSELDDEGVLKLSQECQHTLIVSPLSPKPSSPPSASSYHPTENQCSTISGLQTVMEPLKLLSSVSLIP
ncbi:hypothetical protein TNCV_1572311 [Trichonephila clavipes]|uniref:Uncharacterized protein n=1 Tax=Trichonephila clavipes TaxID=2585209 RepID=A0A8X6SQ73_TRICX|nr:hypothetical protein TNCV_1572311 [Trichonephila clavipes]